MTVTTPGVNALTSNLVGSGLALLRDRHHLRMQIGRAVVVGARQVERAAHLQRGALAAVGAVRVHLVGGLVGKVNGHRGRIGGRCQLQPAMAAVAGGDAIAHHLAGDLHRLLVVIGVGRAQVRDGRVVDKRAVRQLRDVDGVVAFGRLIGERCPAGTRTQGSANANANAAAAIPFRIMSASPACSLPPCAGRASPRPRR